MNPYSFLLRQRAILGLLLLLLLLSQTDCKKLVNVNPPTTALTQTNVYSSDASAIAVLTGIYANMSPAYTCTFCSITNISTIAALSADELTLYDLTNMAYASYYQNTLATNTNGSEFWSLLYLNVFQVNSAIEGLNSSSSLTPAVKQQLIGEAKFMRAFFYFYLVNLYGDVPMALVTDYKANASLTRTAKAKVYQQIINDLKDAQNLLSSKYVDGTVISMTTDRVRPNKWTATALLSRAYLSIGNWQDAEAQGHHDDGSRDRDARDVTPRRDGSSH